MDTIRGEKLFYVFEARSSFNESEEEIGIEGKTELRIDAADREIKVPFPKDRRLLQIESAAKVTHLVKWCLTSLADHMSFGVGPIGIAVKDVAGFIQLIGRSLEASGRVNVIGVQVCKDRSGRSDETLAYSICGSAVFFGDPKGKVFLILLDEVDTAVSRAAVNDDIFEIRITLPDNRLNGFLDELSLVIRRRYYCDTRARAHVSKYSVSRRSDSGIADG